MRCEQQGDETIDAIATELRSPKLKPDIQRSIEIFRATITEELFHPGTRPMNKGLARRGIEWIDGAEKWFGDVAGTPFLEPLHVFPALIQPDDRSDADIFLKTTLRYLAGLREYCQWILDSNYGTHGGVDLAQRYAAILSRRLCLMAGILPIWHDENGAYANVAGLIYRAGTEREVTDMRRALREVTESLKKTGT